MKKREIQSSEEYFEDLLIFTPYLEIQMLKT